MLDTQVCLDLWWFGDARVEALRVALADGAMVGVRDDATRAEWQRVLRYPALGIEAVRRRALEAGYDVRLHPFEHAPCAAPPHPPLPRCADPDDQMFLELALACGARWLVTRDRELLRLARRVATQGRFAIVAPDHWPRPTA